MVSPALDMWDLINGHQVSEALHVAAELQVSDLLADGPRPVDELAGAAGCHAPSLHRLMRALSTLGVYQEQADGNFANTSLSEALRSDAPESMAAWARHIGRPYTRAAWAGMLHGVRTGENAFAAVHGSSAWEYRKQHPADGATFDAAMASMSGAEARWVVDAYDFGRFGTVVDVGGGRGRLLAEVLHRHPGAQGVLFDQPHVVAGALDVLAGFGVEARVRVEPGDFFAAVPAGGDAYLLKSIVHDWEDENAVRLLATCRRAMGEHTSLLLVERLLSGPNEGRLAAFSDLNMMVVPGGQERSESQFAALLAAAGLQLTGVVPTAGAFSIIEARLGPKPTS
jgi:hypothetical protein